MSKIPRRAPHRPWTEAELAALDADYGTTLNEELAKRLGRTVTAIVQMARNRALFKRDRAWAPKRGRPPVVEESRFAGPIPPPWVTGVVRHFCRDDDE